MVRIINGVTSIDGFCLRQLMHICLLEQIYNLDQLFFHTAGAPPNSLFDIERNLQMKDKTDFVVEWKLLLLISFVRILIRVKEVPLNYV